MIHLSSHDPSENRPLTGAVSEDEMTVYWTSTGGEGHVIRKVGIPDGELSEATVVTGGPTLVAHMELSSDERHLLLSDVDMLLVEMVEIATGDISFVTQYGQQDFFPGTYNGDFSNQRFNSSNLYSNNELICLLDINRFNLNQSIYS